ncbi:MAG: AsmA family protein, partial [Acetobacteraceae bacterium]|nr:AsmA family protein [Acetobacteraceae bacterium]
MRAIRAIILILLAIPVLLLVGGFGVLVWFTSSDQLRPRLVAAAREAGYTLELAEPAQIALGFTPAFRLAGLRLAQTGQEPFLAAAEISAKLSLLPLLSGRLDIGEVVLDGPVLRLDLLPRSRRAEAPPRRAPEGDRARPVERGEAFLFTLAGLRLSGLRVLSGPDAPLLEIPRLILAAPDPGRPVSLEGEIRALGTTFTLAGEAGPLGELLAGRPPQAARFSLGAADLSALRPGLRIERLLLSAEAPDRPLALEAAGALGGLVWQATLSAPALAAVAAGREGPFRLEARFGEARLSARGTIGAERLAAEATLSAPALAPLGAAAGIALPPLTRLDLWLRSTLEEAGPLRIEAFRLAAAEAEATATLTLARGARPRVSGEVAVARLDLDALRPAPAAAPARPATAPRPERLIPDLPLPLDPLARADADLRLSAATLRSGGEDYGPIRATARLEGGRLLLDPLSLGLPGGALAGRAEARASGEVALRLAHQGAGLEAARLLPLLGLPGAGSRGMLEVDADLSGRGATTRALAASLSGHLGLAMVDGALANAALRALGAEIARLFGIQGEGVTPLSCLALRMPFAEGTGRTEVLLVETALGSVSGTGQVALGNEQIALRLAPRIAIGGLAVSAPVLVGGTLARPQVGLDPQGAGAALAEALRPRAG